MYIVSHFFFLKNKKLCKTENTFQFRQKKKTFQLCIEILENYTRTIVHIKKFKSPHKKNKNSKPEGYIHIENHQYVKIESP